MYYTCTHCYGKTYRTAPLHNPLFSIASKQNRLSAENGPSAMIIAAVRPFRVRTMYRGAIIHESERASLLEHAIPRRQFATRRRATATIRAKDFPTLGRLVVQLEYGDGPKGGPVLLSNGQAGPGRNFSQPRAHHA